MKQRLLHVVTTEFGTILNIVSFKAENEAAARQCFYMTIEKYLRRPLTEGEESEKQTVDAWNRWEMGSVEILLEQSNLENYLD